MRIATFHPNSQPLLCVFAIASYVAAGVHDNYQIVILDTSGQPIVNSEFIPSGVEPDAIRDELSITLDQLAVKSNDNENQISIVLHGV